MKLDNALAITGYMLESELRYLAEAASKSACTVEIGCWQGRSSRAIGDNALGIVFNVDTWHQLGGENEYQSNMSGLLGNNTFKVKHSSQTAAKIFLDAGIKFDLIFIDAGHEYKDIHADILAWRMLLREGGVLCGHDYQLPFPGVIKAVEELIPHYRIVGGSIWTTEDVEVQSGVSN